MEKQDYINNLKSLNRPGKLKMKERKEVILNENENMQDIHDKIKDFFRKNPNPKDSQIKSLAKEWGMDEDVLEDHIYMVLTSYMKKDDTNLKEHVQRVLQEIFVQSSEIEAIPNGAERDAQILRLGIIAEFDASNLYEKLALLAKDAMVKKVMLDISREEKVHVGEFEAVLKEIDPDFDDTLDEGDSEVEDMKK